MNDNGKLPDCTEIWLNASRAHEIYQALQFALIAAAFTGGWKSLQRQNPAAEQDSVSLGKPAEPRTSKKANAF